MINLNAVRKYLQEPNKSLEHYIGIIATINELQSQIKHVINEYDNYKHALKVYNAESKKFYKDIMNIFSVFPKSKPTIDMSRLEFYKFFYPIFRLARIIQSHDSIQIELYCEQ